MAGQSVSDCTVLVKTMHGAGEREEEERKTRREGVHHLISLVTNIVVPISQIGSPSQRHEATCQVISNKKENIATGPVLPDLKAIAFF